MLDKVNNITTEDFQRGGERPEREELASAIAEAIGLSDHPYDVCPFCEALERAGV